MTLRLFVALAFFVEIAYLALPAPVAAQPNNRPPALQSLIDAAQPGDTLTPPAGTYRGPVIIDRPLVLDGRGVVRITGNGHGTVVHITAAEVTLRRLIISDSGDNLNTEDAGIAVDAPAARIQENRLENVLFGIYLRKAHRSLVQKNTIRGKAELEVPRRGDLIRAWYCNEIRIEDNRLESGRDLIVWFSRGSTVARNRVRGARYGIHFMYSEDCTIEQNVLLGNAVGVYLMYSKRLQLRYNTIAYNRGPTGFGVGLKDLDDTRVQGNWIVDNRVGIFVDNSPRAVNAHMWYHNNVIAYNDFGMNLLSFVKRNSLTENSFIENYEQVAVTGSGLLSGNEWLHNYWSDHLALDQDGDGYGDLPYRSEKLYEDMVARRPELRFFVYSPVIQAVNFAGRAFPLVKPQPKFVDAAPLVRPLFPEVRPPLDRRNHSHQSGSAVAALVLGATMLLLASRRGLLLRAAGVLRGKHGEQTMIVVKQVNKSFGEVRALEGVDLRIEAGEAVALWGPNGAGKTTLLRCLLGVIPFEGAIEINGFQVPQQGKQARFHTGFVPQEIGFHDNFTVMEALRFYAALKRAPKEAANQWLERVGLADVRQHKIRKLSGGMKQRLALAIAMLADPPVLLLDEVLPLADRIVLMESGRIVRIDDNRTNDATIGASHHMRIFMPREQIPKALSLLQEQNFAATSNGNGIKLRINGRGKIQPLALLLQSGIDIEDFDYEPGE